MSEPKFIPQTFQAQSNNLISFTFTELATNTGYVTLYFITDGTSYELSTQPYDSQLPYTVLSFAAAGIALRSTQDWDYTFQKPLTIKGDFVFRCSIEQNDASGGTNTQTSKVDIRIIHYDGTTETELVDSTGVNGTWLDTDQPNGIVLVNKGTIPAKHFKRGDILRIEVQIYSGTDGTGYTSDHNVFHDGAGKALAGVYKDTAVNLPTQMKIDIPIRVDELGV